MRRLGVGSGGGGDRPVRAQIVGADFCAEDESGDAHRFSEQLAARAAEAGVRFLFSTTFRLQRREVVPPVGHTRFF